MDQPFNVQYVRSETELRRYELLVVDSDLCATFIDSAWMQLTLGNREHAQKALAYAERALEVMEGFLPRVMNGQQQSEIRSRLGELRKSLDAIHD